MRAITLNTFGGPEVLTLTETEKPTPGPDQLLIRVKAAALNRADLLQRRGKYPPPPGESAILGLEIAGEIVAMGENVTHFTVGERIFGLVGGGGYAEYCLIDSLVAMPIPEGMTFVEAAAISEAFLTASEALFTLGQLQPNEAVLIHAGGSGVGSAAIQLARESKAVIFTTVSSADKVAKVKALGATHIINYKETDFAPLIEAQHGVDVIIDFVGASYLSRHLHILKPAGRLVCVGLMGGKKTEIDLEPLQRKRLQIKGLIMRSRTLNDKRDITARFKKQWLSFFATHQLQAVVDSVFSFTEVQAAHARMESNANVGKIILQVG